MESRAIKPRCGARAFVEAGLRSPDGNVSRLSAEGGFETRPYTTCGARHGPSTKVRVLFLFVCPVPGVFDSLYADIDIIPETGRQPMILLRFQP